MIELTGYHFPSKQCKALEHAGIFFIRRPDGYPKTTWYHFYRPLNKRHAPPEQEEPNYGAI